MNSGWVRRSRRQGGVSDKGVRMSERRLGPRDESE